MKTSLKDIKREFGEFSKHNYLPKNIQLHTSDIRIGRKVGIVNTENGYLNLLVSYRSYSEMLSYLQGYNDSKIKFLRKNTVGV